MWFKLNDEKLATGKYTREDAEKIIRDFFAKHKGETGYVSTLTFANLVYVMRKELAPDKIQEVFQQLRLIFEFADFNSGDLSKAAELNWKDFEDAVQIVTAERIQADYIVTRNVRNFADSKVMAYTPSELLARI
jgi:hypothetical protein